MLAGANLDLEAVQQACKNRFPLGKAPADWLQCAAADVNLKQWSRFKHNSGMAQVRDARVAQVVVLNPLIGSLFGEAGLKTVQTPVLMLAGTEDTFTPALSQQFRPFQQLTTAKYLVTAIGGTHLSVGDPSLSGKVAESQLTAERQGEAAEPLRRLMRGVTLAFVQQLTPQSQTYQPFLTPDYAQLLSKSNFPLRLSTELSTNLVKEFF
jgi:predicted dienelactone hydrolase